MAEKGGEMIPLKVFFDKQRERVVFAESNSHLVDILFSFLTLPIGTIIKLLRKDQSESIFGCINTLYGGIENLDREHFIRPGYKHWLLEMKNPSQSACRKLKLNIDNTEPATYYLCDTCYSLENALVAFHQKTICRCGKVPTKVMYSVDDFDGYRAVGSKEGVFVKETEATLIITDDLQVIPSSTATTLELLAKFGVKDVNSLKEKTLNIGLPEVLSLLKLSLVSKTPLTDMILLKHLESSSLLMCDRGIQVKSQEKMDTVEGFVQMTLKVMFQKSKKMLLYVEAKEDFINFLITLPAITLGSMVKLLDKTPSLGCICNLYKSVESLGVDGYIKSEDVKASLLSPKLAIQIGYHSTKILLTNMSKDESVTVHPDATSLMAKNAKSPTFENLRRLNIKGASVYMVTDDLIVTPILSSVSALDHLQVPLSDLEVREVTFGLKEAQRLLEASLISRTALSTAFNFNVSPKKDKLTFGARVFKSALERCFTVKNELS